MAVLESEVGQMQTSQNKMGAQVDALYIEFIERRGGRKAAIAIWTVLMTAGGILGGVVVKVWPLIFKTVI